MKIANVIALVSISLFVAGCTNTRPTRYTTTTTTPAHREVISSPRIEVYQPVRSETGAAVVTEDRWRTSSDQELTSAVQREFQRYGDLNRIASNIGVAAHNGTITLTGDVPTQRDKQMIEAMVRNTVGVVEVNNLLLVTDPQIGSIQPTSRPGEPARVYARSLDNVHLHVQGLSDADRRLGQQILAGLQADTAAVSPDRQIDISVHQGRVSLRGTVANEFERQNLAAAVRRAAGMEIQNELQIR
jgi:osmotically-inducible protein OsmY